ncbi:hypothetical protein PSN45_003472 [Yamadazyma tenuis]|uniref:RNA polymerase II assembly factor Rtp1 C-terminal domain-containing protein n=1 Tax=Candida tenuis (strain ATCC 10573 / BCRC 21748 / CBS 615 / JCM 9827 / NBRC 10315 / NRRL Y-1498 / VKM Y-70) TaxID=590646 RepID=G3AY07_CANTC|nr:uncharacterized protein CANTEDRAFT_118349 [Yamadazyma tenuis ATCC 10573]EGV65740.1 hypothetical protein CANTEDRAFT_118349 [Yamadazyma tenuis ATCC 10573]WEJ95941.1 hypothetical protein PSN45_003472 [Yamadazyma tenuis]
MPPKIEEVSGKSSTRKHNPFEPKPKKTTIRRDAKEIYGADGKRKGLHKPQYTKGSPLDKSFSLLEDVLQGTLDDITLSVLAERLKIHSEDEFDVRYSVISRLLDFLLQIQEQSGKENQPDKNLINISLHDIKTFSKLVNMIIIHGVYPGLATFKVGIPLAKRRLNEFSKTKKPIKVERIPSNTTAKTYTERFGKEEKLLNLLYSKFKSLFEKEGDVRDLLTKGTGYSDFLTISITLITCPYFNNNKKALVEEFESLVVQLPGTYELFQTYSLLLSTPSPAYFKQFVMKKLQTLHYDAPKKDGVLTLVEFVLGLRENEDVSVERFDHVANVILAKPKHISTVHYFTSIGNQLYDILVNINRPHVTSCIGHVLEMLWVRNKLVVNDFFLKRLWDNLNPTIEDKPDDGVLVSEKDFNNAINVLISLTKKSLSPDFSQYVFNPILLPLWRYFVFVFESKKSYEVLLNILVGYFVTTGQSDDINKDIYGLDTISKNLLFSTEDWEFMWGPNNLPQITKSKFVLQEDRDKKMVNFFSDLDTGSEAYIELLKNLDDALVSKVFKTLLRRWLKLGNNKDVLDSQGHNPFIVLVDLRLIESIGSQFKEDIAKTPIDMLQIVDEFLSAQKNTNSRGRNDLNIVKDSDDEDSDDEENFDSDVNSEAMPILFQLLSAILTDVSEDDITENCKVLLKKVLSSLKVLSKHSNPTIVSSLNTIKALASRISSMLAGDTPVTSEKDLHRRTLERAITSLNDPLVPIRAHGLYLLRELIEVKSDVISLDFVINLHLIQLKDPEPFIYLNVIKGLESLINLGKLPVIQILVGVYTNEAGNNDIDERLRIGEVLLRFIQSSNQLFAGEIAETIVSATVSMIRRSESGPKNQDNRIRMSSMSLLGVCCKVNPLGILYQLSDILDCAIGILTLETGKDQAIMRRSAVVLIHDLILGTSDTEEVPFPEEYREKVLNTLRYILETDEDLLTREQAQSVLDDIEELVQLAYQEARDKMASSN